MILILTATPHSGDEEAFGRLLSLIEPSFGAMNFDDVRYRERLARHFVQRQRIDLVSGEWGEIRAFPKHETTEFPTGYRKSISISRKRCSTTALALCRARALACGNGASPSGARSP